MARPVRLIVCINERLGSGQRSCVGSGGLDLIQQIETMILGANLDVPVVRRECLGRCEEGPMMRFTLAGPLFTAIYESTLEGILAQLKSLAARHAD